VTSTIPWSSASRVAARLAGSYPLEGSYHFHHLTEQAPGLVDRAARLVEEETGLRSQGMPEVVVVTRSEWAERNVASFSVLLAPAEERLAAAAGDSGSGLSRRVLAAETGALLGLLARRVLGQYELVLPTGSEADIVTLVGANILALERTHQLDPAEFRSWLALHECTHRLQFTAVPWLRGYFRGLVNDLVESAQPEPGRLARVAAEVAKALRTRQPVVDDTGLIGLFASPEQRAVLRRVQALMSLLEGHGHVVMDRVGGRVLQTQERMSRLLKARRSDPRLAALFRLTGLDLKMKQYELGERFVIGVEAVAGWAALDAVWEDPASLPSLDEIEQPGRWLARVA
jgi:coenzyme F420 biosynthesis associated uncharacterized protein